VLDAGIIVAAQKVEHYEIAGYGSVRRLAIGARGGKLSLPEGFGIYDAFGKSVEKFIRFRFFIQSSLQKLCRFVLTKQMDSSAAL
jgi:hypothetical protein